MAPELVWLIAGIVLVIVELLTGTFYLLILGVAAMLTVAALDAVERLSEPEGPPGRPSHDDPSLVGRDDLLEYVADAALVAHVELVDHRSYPSR